MTKAEAARAAELIDKLAAMHASNAAETVENHLSDWDGSPSYGSSDFDKTIAELAACLTTEES